MIIILLTISMIVLCSLIAILSYVSYINRLEKKVAESKIVNSAAIILHEYGKLRISKYSEKFPTLNKYIEHNSTIFYDLVQSKNLKVGLINVKLEKNEKDIRIKLMNEFKTCPGEYIALCEKINMCLEMIYKHNHPAKYKLYLLRKRLNLYLVKLLIFILTFILKFLPDEKQESEKYIDSHRYEKEIVYMP